ncbi:MAG: GTPase Era [Rhodospirillales bacterium CG15_BIG_FIL_POST_REV_8_21_14_020_66_15]|nr:MAG: GTPase Era [Rhodospirillales bacterium CG15_BIG_FIL_POST_REV_8_21_14_020_66_15]
MSEAGTRAGFIAVLGAPNVGKSTLVNRLVGAKVSIVSPKVQTTRTRVLGIFIEGPSQVILVDTPGIFEPKGRLDRAMVAAAWSGAKDADAVALLIDAKAGVDARSQAIIDRLKADNRKAFLILNKIDLVAKPALLTLAESLMNTGVFTDCFMVSANTGDGVKDLAKVFAGAVPEGPWLFPEDEISDMPARLLAAEITREKLFLDLHQELPYKITVETEDWEQQADGSARVHQVVYVERDSQKGIVLGKQGAMIKRIGAAARTELQDLLGHPVHLFIHVKVRGKWQDDRERYAEWGLDFDA